MAAVRRGQSPLNLDLPKTSKGSNNPDFPPISALFLIYFDIKAGYTIGWRRSLPGVELEGVVEYKSLPSGLHTVKEDLIYFVHDDHAGLSAFVNAPADEESRNSRMIAVGIMVPLSFGRLGRSWKHADKLKEMASELIVDTTKTKALEEFWEEHMMEESAPGKETNSLLVSPSSLKKPRKASSSRLKGHNRYRSASDRAALLHPGQTLSTYHPAWSLPNLLETFGPLIFPIHRAALLRKRILITAHAPVAEVCNFVYDISVLSNIPLAVSDLIAPTAPPQRLRPLFSIGVHDIPLLEEDLRASKAAATYTNSLDPDGRDERGCGWIACTTDSILAMKSALYDVLITLPPAYSSDSKHKVWPKVEYPQGVEMKATQRDLRRYNSLRWGLSRHHISPSTPRSSTSSQDTVAETETDTILLAASSSTAAPKPRSHHRADDPLLDDMPDADSIVEPTSWSALAYSGFMWWASAGEQRMHVQEETDMDAALLSGLSLPLTPSSPRPAPQSAGSSLSRKGDMTAKTEMAIIAYFHRLTTQMLTVMGDIVDATDSDDERESRGDDSDSRPLILGDGTEEDDEETEVWVSSHDVVKMGLDIWSGNDHLSVEEVGREYFGRRTKVQGVSVDICGIRIC